MAITDNLSGSISTLLNFALARASDGDFSGVDRMQNTYTRNFTNGAGVDQATCWLTGQGTVTFAAAITCSLADSVNPLSTISNNVPSADPEGLKIKMMLITNLDATNIVTLSSVGAAWSLTDFGTTLIYPLGMLVWVAPGGGITINDGADDEIQLQAAVGDCICRIDVLYG